MQRIPALSAEQASEPARTLLVGMTRKFGKVPGLIGVLAHSPKVLRGFMELRAGLSAAQLSPKIRESIAIAIASHNRCKGCLAAHIDYGREVGLDEPSLLAAQLWGSDDPRAAIALVFAKRLMMTAGHVDDLTIIAAREAGLADVDLVEIAVTVGINLLTNIVNSLATQCGQP